MFARATVFTLLFFTLPVPLAAATAFARSNSLQMAVQCNTGLWCCKTPGRTLSHASETYHSFITTLQAKTFSLIIARLFLASLVPLALSSAPLMVLLVSTVSASLVRILGRLYKYLKGNYSLIKSIFQLRQTCLLQGWLPLWYPCPWLLPRRQEPLTTLWGECQEEILEYPRTSCSILLFVPGIKYWKKNCSVQVSVYNLVLDAEGCKHMGKVLGGFFLGGGMAVLCHWNVRACIGLHRSVFGPRSGITNECGFANEAVLIWWET